MSKTSSAAVCETNQVQGKNQENVFFHSLYRMANEYGSSYVRSAKSTAPIQICALFSAQGEDTLAAMTLQTVLAKMQELCAQTQLMSVLDYESFTNQVVTVLNNTVCNESVKHNGAKIQVSMSMVIIEGDTLRVLNIGNTHIWMFRQGKLISLTENQTVAHRYVQMGAIPKEAEFQHEGRNELTQYLGRFAQDGEVLPDKKVHLKLMDGDELVMIGTGLDQEVKIQKLGTVIARPTQPETKAADLVHTAMEEGVKAGLTAIVIRVESTLLLPGDADIEAAAVSNDLSVASKPVAAAAPVAAPMAAAAADAPTIQSDELRHQMSQQLMDDADLSDEDDDYDDDEDDYEIDEKPKKERKNKEKKNSPWKYVLIGFLIFLVSGVIGYTGMYVLFNISHWTGRLNSIDVPDSTEQIEENVGIVVYCLYDETSLYVEESLDSQVIDTLSRGEAVTLLASNDNFAKVRKENGLMGYVPLEMISNEDPTIGEVSPTEFIDPTPVPTAPVPDDTEPVTPTTEIVTQPVDSSSETTPTETTPQETSSETIETPAPSETPSSSETSETPAPSETPSSSETSETPAPSETPSSSDSSSETSNQQPADPNELEQDP
ncbi:MAG: hypothetical protein IK109_06375 [Clostridiales bacterium]|nr:hypothetical protein [Clostridiales bacterium]